MDGKLSSNWTQLHRSIPSFAPLSYLHISSPTLLFSLPISSLFLRPTGSLPLLSYSTDVNVAFQQAMVKVGMENEDLMKQFKLTVTLPQQEERRPQGPGPATKKGEGAWKHLNLAHSVSWPLHILFTPAILEKYDCRNIFIFYMRVFFVLAS